MMFLVLSVSDGPMCLSLPLMFTPAVFKTQMIFFAAFALFAFFSVTFGMRQHIFATQYNPKHKCAFLVRIRRMTRLFRLRNLAQSISLLRH